MHCIRIYVYAYPILSDCQRCVKMCDICYECHQIASYVAHNKIRNNYVSSGIVKVVIICSFNEVIQIVAALKLHCFARQLAVGVYSAFIIGVGVGYRVINVHAVQIFELCFINGFIF